VNEKMMNYGYGKLCPNWKEGRKQELATALRDLLVEFKLTGNDTSIK